jgi:formate dehydrogenase maturation protein FdhE
VNKRGASKGVAESAFDRRSHRAELLVKESESARDPLRFAAGLYQAQGRMAGELESSHASSPLTGSLANDAERLVRAAPRLLRYAVESGPEALSNQARARMLDEPSVVRSRLLVYWTDDSHAREDYFSRALLRPYVEVLANLRISPDRRHRPGRCPFCGGPAWIASRRSDSGMDGALRLLGCALCGGEWQFNRGRCPCCSEEDPYKLPTFQSDAHPSVRIEACETCHRYVKSIDQTLDARTIPEVDDLLSLSMDVWASEAGFTRIEPGLAGI